MNRKILIVDDNPENLYYLESLFKGHGFGVIVTANGREALDRARSDPPDAVVSDILMPVMDGYSLCWEWRGDERLKAIPFIFYTATYTEPKDEELALSLGADRFVLKPQEPDVLMGILEEVWRSPRPPSGGPPATRSSSGGTARSCRRSSRRRSGTSKPGPGISRSSRRASGWPSRT